MTTNVVSRFGGEDSGDTRRGLVHQVGPFFGKNTSFVTQKTHVLNKAIYNNKKKLNNKNIFIFGIKPTNPSSEYGYFLTKKINKSINKVTKFIEKPKLLKAKQVNTEMYENGTVYTNHCSITVH